MKSTPQYFRTVKARVSVEFSHDDDVVRPAELGHDQLRPTAPLTSITPLLCCAARTPHWLQPPIAPRSPAADTDLIAGANWLVHAYLQAESGDFGSSDKSLQRRQVGGLYSSRPQHGLPELAPARLAKLSRNFVLFLFFGGNAMECTWCSGALTQRRARSHGGGLERRN